MRVITIIKTSRGYSAPCDVSQAVADAIDLRIEEDAGVSIPIYLPSFNKN